MRGGEILKGAQGGRSATPGPTPEISVNQMRKPWALMTTPADTTLAHLFANFSFNQNVKRCREIKDGPIFGTGFSGLPLFLCLQEKN